ncbi:hypothetical protein F5Y00DRAFT_238230 [Daldinia vernicosa]|uniref:uncharacterized protein n=1 Tax=Daldinia vernicosa TaxID=114800 RepID=UPI0020084D32|nr:uncharacterized protein F5Y00DRAFT_238230 [Daldinia vernicosa]KAI0848371.1 hypothetical protein F5Y00DRAFT_238230 [Daldinia vernicosa]
MTAVSKFAIFVVLVDNASYGAFLRGSSYTSYASTPTVVVLKDLKSRLHINSRVVNTCPRFGLLLSSASPIPYSSNS